MKHIFLSPHPDDAVLSCGGTIYRLTQAGEFVEILTLMAGDMPCDASISPFIQEHLDRWGLGPDPVPGRRSEDRAAAEQLGAVVTSGPFADALYRTNDAGQTLYNDLDALFGNPLPDDPVLESIHAVLPTVDADTILYAPMGAGHHIDHVLVRDAISDWSKAYPQVAVSFYEEYPYSADRPDVVELACRALWTPVQSEIVTLSEAAMCAKIAAVACHHSQISTFWADLDAMAAAVRAYAHQVGRTEFAERFWRPVIYGNR